MKMEDLGHPTPDTVVVMVVVNSIAMLMGVPISMIVSVPMIVCDIAICVVLVFVVMRMLMIVGLFRILGTVMRVKQI
ncbi:MAG: hypothetical protein ACK2UO_03060 [Caldilineaceae bacterium]